MYTHPSPNPVSSPCTPQRRDLPCSACPGIPLLHPRPSHARLCGSCSELRCAVAHRSEKKNRQGPRCGRQERLGGCWQPRVGVGRGEPICAIPHHNTCSHATKTTAAPLACSGGCERTHERTLCTQHHHEGVCSSGSSCTPPTCRCCCLLACQQRCTACAGPRQRTVGPFLQPEQALSLAWPCVLSLCPGSCILVCQRGHEMFRLNSPAPHSIHPLHPFHPSLRRQPHQAHSFECRKRGE
jgi:hypothetical protein